jgi:hypothetical protein
MKKAMAMLLPSPSTVQEEEEEESCRDPTLG